MSYKDLVVWQKSMDLVEDLYRITADLPKNEQYGLTSQIRRSAVSIPSNLAGGSRRGTRKDNRQFVLIAFGSASELETQLEIVGRLKLIPNTNLKKSLGLLDEILKMLNKLQQSLQ